VAPVCTNTTPHGPLHQILERVRGPIEASGRPPKIPRGEQLLRLSAEAHGLRVDTPRLVESISRHGQLDPCCLTFFLFGLWRWPRMPCHRGESHIRSRSTPGRDHFDQLMLRRRWPRNSQHMSVSTYDLSVKCFPLAPAPHLLLSFFAMVDSRGAEGGPTGGQGMAKRLKQDRGSAREGDRHRKRGQGGRRL